MGDNQSLSLVVQRGSERATYTLRHHSRSAAARQLLTTYYALCCRAPGWSPVAWDVVVGDEALPTRVEGWRELWERLWEADREQVGRFERITSHLVIPNPRKK